jgi:hypothetical protein
MQVPTISCNSQWHLHEILSISCKCRLPTSQWHLHEILFIACKCRLSHATCNDTYMRYFLSHASAFYHNNCVTKLQIPDSVPVPKTTESTSRIPFSSILTVIPKKSDGSAVSHLATPTADRPRNVPVNSVDIRNPSQFRPEYLKE